MNKNMLVLMRKIGMVAIALFAMVAAVQAQSDAGKVRGTITDENDDPVPYATVKAVQDGIIRGGTYTDEEGKYEIFPLPPGEYVIEASFSGNEKRVSGVQVIALKTQDVDVKITTGVTTEEVVIRETIPIDNTTTGGTISGREVRQSGIRSINSLAGTVPGVYSSDDGNTPNIRGGRSQSTVYYVDGVKVRGGTGLAQSAIGQLTVITGGTPAEYGDFTGGVVNVTTSGPSAFLRGGVELLSSQFLDPQQFNLVAVNLSGPIISRYIDSLDYNKPILGFFLAVEGNITRDADPPAIPVYELSDEVRREIEQNPLIINPNAEAGAINFVSPFNFVDSNDIIARNYKSGNGSQSFRVNGRLDFEPKDNILIKAGGTYEYLDRDIWNQTNGLFNTANNGELEQSLFRGWVRFQQNFANDENSKVKNLFYTLQADYNSFSRVFQSDRHKDNFFDYNYMGKFDYDLVPNYTYINPGDPLHEPGISSSGYYLFSGYTTDNLSFEPGSQNPILANYNTTIIDYAANTGIINPFTGQRETSIQNLDFLRFFGGLRNGDDPATIYSLYRVSGHNGYTSDRGTVPLYQTLNYQQARLTGQLSGQLGRHNLKVGFEAETRNEISYTNVSGLLWNYMRQLTNTHLVGINTDPNTWELRTQSGIFQDTVDAPLLYSAGSQSTFDANLRNILGKPVDGTELINIDALDPSTFNMNMFGIEEILNEGSSYAYYRGTDVNGNRTERRPWQEFFTDTEARPINSFNPTYFAAFIQDKFELEDIIFNVGVRVDRFDANQPTLKDNYSLLPTRTAAEAVNEFGDGALPANIGADFVPYMDNANNPTAIVGYRNPEANTWFDVNGNPVSSAAIRSAGGGTVQPWLSNDEIGVESFTDYVPQTVVMPRLSFSFPISDQAVFFAHYDVLAQRPGQLLNTQGSLIAADLPDYYYLPNRPTIQVTNPNLKPERTIDYEVGFKQRLNDFMALSISAFYREMRDMIQSVSFVDAYPVNYTTYDNIDFGTVKGFTFALNMLRIKHLRFNASYTLQFAQATGSSFTSSRNALNSIEGFTAIRTLLPTTFDQRHRLTGNLDYRFSGDDDKGPAIQIGNKTIYPLKNTGFNLTAFLGSGTPYSVNAIPDPAQVAILINSNSQLDGTPLGSRLPANVRLTARVNKSFTLGGKDKTNDEGEKFKSRAYELNVYLAIQNLLNTKNILAVYKTSGLPDDDGFLNTLVGEQRFAAEIDPETAQYLYSLKMQNPNNFSRPRTIRLGVQLNF